MESATQIVKKEHKTFFRRRLTRTPPPPPPPPPPLPPSLSSSSSVPLNLTPAAKPEAPGPIKRTRDLPDFSECHACGFRIDVVDGRSRLNSLYSEWRIVLLCKKCFSLVESSQVCSYCFADSRGDSFNCCDCNRRVHTECFAQYSRVAPWSYSSSGSVFSVCIDCWVPKPIVTARAILKNRKIRRKNIHASDLQSSKVSTTRDCKSLTAILKDSNCSVEKKGNAAVRAGEHAPKKTAVDRTGFELASDALNLVAQRDESTAKESRESADDAELAIELHRAMNSSPRLSKNFCSVNSNYMACENVRVDDGDTSIGVLNSREFNFCKTPRVLIHNNVCNSLDKAASEDHVAPLEINRESMGKDPMPIKGNACRELPPKDDLRSRSIKLRSAGCDHQLPHKQDKSALPGDERCRCIAKPYHYFFKYRRRDTTNRYLLKYSKRNSKLKRTLDCKPNILVDGTCLGVPSSSAAILINTEKFPVVSNSSFGCRAVPLQSSGLNAVQEISNQGGR
ncbi:uncharacterized protein LOC111793145 [Cucurbita pepo subsp. pepo]|uniref:uncharacterized protein LOC111793145 n=1 Tax=Cucurbita pepo subsp. pepo TaxID=3664 RepID=UPI000C9D5F9E|nr:uncharacterized protein LOC111793145 [Cucurbita pepo subsp. pepo]XP_023530662.1 uncharacterized protein LOC111793145 [Cucurbita pepo subsp. pepo]